MFNASASGSKGKADGEDVSYTNTKVTAKDEISITSGGDTTLQGAVVRANQVRADIGGNLKIDSLQDSSIYTSKQTSFGASASGGMGKGSVSVNAARTDIQSEFKSVGEQSGIKAGKPGSLRKQSLQVPKRP